MNHFAKALEFAQLLLRRYSYDITFVGKLDIPTPPFWIDMSKLFELYVFRHLRKVFTGKHEVRYHVNANYQELDYLLKPELWASPYVIDAKYKPGFYHSIMKYIFFGHRRYLLSHLKYIYGIHPRSRCFAQGFEIAPERLLQTVFARSME